MKNEVKKKTMKRASKAKCCAATVVNLALLLYAVKLTFEFSTLEKDFSNIPLAALYACVVFYYYFIFTLFPHTIFSQGLGEFLFGVKVVTKFKHERLTLSQSIKHGFFLGRWSGSTVVDIR